jgi:hypothetical protein
MTHETAEALARSYAKGIDRFELPEMQIAEIDGVK